MRVILRHWIDEAGDVITGTDVANVAYAARHLPPGAQSYHEEDDLMNLLETIVDLRSYRTAGGGGLEHRNALSWNEIPTPAEGEALFGYFPQDAPGAIALVRCL